MCSVCVAVCWGVLLVVCLVGIGGLVWMCIQLKKDVDQLRIQLDKGEVAFNIGCLILFISGSLNC